MAPTGGLPHRHRIGDEGQFTIWERIWFGPMPAWPLALCRILFFAYLALRVAPDAATADWSTIEPALWMPTDLFAALHLGVARPGLLRALDALWFLALLLSCVGWCTRVSTGLALLVGAYVLGLPQCFGKVDHWSGLLVLVMLVLALARCGDAWSIDCWLTERRARLRGSVGPTTRASGEYRWPIQLVRLTMALVFFAAGIAKLRFSGIAWFDPRNMAAILIQPHYAIDRSPTALGLLLAASPSATALLAAATVLAEVSAPLALLGGPPAVLIVGTLFAMQLGSALLLGVHANFPFLACYAFWIPWRSAAERFARLRAALL